MHIQISKILLAVTFILFCTPGYSYSLFTCPGGINPKWTNPNQTWRLNSSQFSNAARNSMADAASRIRAIRGSSINPFTQSVALGNPEPVYGNGFNDVFVDSTQTYIPFIPGVFNGIVVMSAAADCSNLTSNGRFIEVDIAFETGFNYTGLPNSFPYAGSLFAHELGHAVGVGHEDTGVLAQMNASIAGVLGGPSNVEQGTPAFHGQDVLAVRQIYPDSTTGTNIYVSKWRRGPGPFNMANNNTPRSANLLRFSTGGSVPNNALIFSGQNYRLDYTAGNTSTSPKLTRVEMRISSPNNQNIHFGNQILATRTHFLQPGQSVESQINFTMPALLRNRRYYFGYTAIPTAGGDNDAADDRTILTRSFRGR